MRSLDQFYRYIEQREGGKEKADKTEEQQPEAKGAKAAGTKAKALRYVLRNGVTIPVSAEEEEPAPPATAVTAATAIGDDAAVSAVFPKLQPADGDAAAALPALSEEEPTDAAEAADAARWRALPDAVRALARLADDAATAQGDRRQLIERLLNPLLTLEDAARLLGVHPGTVRRWANKGSLPHQRTVGQQRRFHLADVLECRERREQETAGESAPEPDEA